MRSVLLVLQHQTILLFWGHRFFFFFFFPFLKFGGLTVLGWVLTPAKGGAHAGTSWHPIIIVFAWPPC